MKLSPIQIETLRRAAEIGPASELKLRAAVNADMQGRAGGFTATLSSLYRRGLLSYRIESSRFHITAAGREAAGSPRG